MKSSTHQDMADNAHSALDDAISYTVDTLRRYADEIERDCLKRTGRQPGSRAAAALAGITHMMTNIDMRGIAYWAAMEAEDRAKASSEAQAGKADA